MKELVEEQAILDSWVGVASMPGDATFYAIERKGEEESDAYAINATNEGIHVSRVVFNATGSGPESFNFPTRRLSEGQFHYYAPNGYITDTENTKSYPPVHRVFQRDMTGSDGDDNEITLFDFYPEDCILDNVGTQVYPETSKIAGQGVKLH